ncbi:6808_t:CDS:2 [Entrophospora sp. SA101]|nr:6808_t:CDS:2 [Entrophospora sp. SA101]CAJ0840205.1 16221_t:CDS:2 [Entrophospora sp. SA101]
MVLSLYINQHRSELIKKTLQFLQFTACIETSNLYPHKFETTLTIPEFIKKYQNGGVLEKGDVLLEEEVSLAGRIIRRRDLGSKLIFFDLQGQNQTIQIKAHFQFQNTHKDFDRGDVVGVETPMMNLIPSGAYAKPFKTYHESLKSDLYMRISPELYLKQLVIGGFDRVFEIGRQFRNESIDTTHNTEFTTCEFYMAYSDMYDLMEFTEKMVMEILKNFNNDCGGSNNSSNDHHVLDYKTSNNENLKIDFSLPFKRIDIIPTLEDKLKVKFPSPSKLHTEESRLFLEQICNDHKITCNPPKTNSRLFNKIIDKIIETECISPTFIVGFPKMMSPLAKSHREIEGLCERFELLIARREIVNAYTELNDPFEQRGRFEEQSQQRDQGDDEAQLIDESYCKSLEYGLPPTAGWGMGIDRLIMILTNSSSIKEVILFPAVKDLD